MLGAPQAWRPPMPVALAPLALTALRIGAAGLLVAALAARRGRAPLDEAREAALDDLPEGGSLTLDPDARRMDAAGRWRRTLRLGADGPGLMLEAAALLRLRIRRA
jgi:hypothetical protein